MEKYEKNASLPLNTAPSWVFRSYSVLSYSFCFKRVNHKEVAWLALLQAGECGRESVDTDPYLLSSVVFNHYVGFNVILKRGRDCGSVCFAISAAIIVKWEI